MPIRLCLHVGCPNPVAYRGRCPTHSRQRERQTHPNKHVYGSKRWRLTRRKQLHNHPLCQHRWPDDGEFRAGEACGVIATDVDHIVPIEQGGSVWASANLQSLCAMHHGQKTRREQQGATP